MVRRTLISRKGLYQGRIRGTAARWISLEESRAGDWVTGAEPVAQPRLITLRKYPQQTQPTRQSSGRPT